MVQFQIGSYAAMALRDGALHIPNDAKVFGLGHEPAEVGALLENAGQPPARLDLSIQPLLVRAGDRVLLFDAGAGTSFGSGAGHLLMSMAAAHVDPASVTDVFISHPHGDHVEGLLDTEGAPAFQRAAIHISSPAWKYLQDMDAAVAETSGIKHRSALLAAMRSNVVPFVPGADILPGLVKAIDLPGHTPGHSGFLITSGGRSLLFTGDVLHHFIVSVSRPDWPVAWDTDPRTAEATRQRLLTDAAASGRQLYVGHFPFPGLGRIERRDSGFVWVPD